MHVTCIIKSGPKRVGRKHNWAEKDWAENKSGPKSDLPIKTIIVRSTNKICAPIFPYKIHTNELD